MSAPHPAFQWWMTGLAGAALLAAFASHAGAEPAQSGEAEDGGIRIRWRYEARVDAPGLGTLVIETRDALAGTPVDYGSGRLLAWLQARRAALVDTETPCSARIRTLVAGGLGQRADIDLNGYRLLTLNTDGSLAVINPFVALNNAKLEAIVDLGGVPADWVELPDRQETWILLPEPPTLVAVDMQTRRVARRVALPPAARPRSLVVDAGLLRIDLPGVDALGTFDPAGAGPVEIAPLAAGARVLPIERPREAEGDGGIVTAGPDGAVSLQQGRDPPRRWRIAGAPAVAAFSPLAERLVVATAAGDLHWLDPRTPDGVAPDRSLHLSHSVSRVHVLDNGRRLVAMGNGQASLVDLAKASVDLVFDAPADADQFAETDRFLYAVSTASGHARLWSLADLSAGRARPLDVVTGSPAPDALPAASGRAATAPEGNGLLVANPADGMIYQYAEGMMAPTGSFSNYRRAALGLLVEDLSLRQTAPGRYRGTVRHAKGGNYDLLIGGASPRIAACASLSLAPVGGEGERREAPVAVAMIGKPEPVRPLTFDLRLVVWRGAGGQASPLAGVRDLTLLVFDRRSGWQQRIRLADRGEGEYGGTVAVPEAGRYELLASSASEDISFLAGRVGEITLGATP